LTDAHTNLTPGIDELMFLPLGGTGEIGMNLNLYGHAGKWLMVDLGVMFRDKSSYELDVIMADPSFISERRDDLAGLVLTHAHEDHIGALPYLWTWLRCPIYATPFTASLVARKLREAGLAKKAKITEVPMSGKFDVGPFSIELVTLTHSIPEPNAVVIRTTLGTVVHTGDWKLDPDPLVGPTVDENALIDIGKSGVLATVCDSTNALVEGQSGSEGDLRRSLVDIIDRFEQRVAVGCFASNVARLETLAFAAEANGRYAALVGRSLWRMHDAARENGYLADVPAFLTPKEAGYLPRDEVLLICTGSQGEARATLPRIAAGRHPEIILEEGDVAIFSSRIIPGNEKSIDRLQARLIQMGVEIVTTEDEFVHVSGHPAREELRQMYQWLRPHIAIPVHGENPHLDAHTMLARDCQVPNVLRIENGDMVQLSPGRAHIAARVKTGRLGVERGQLVQLEPAVTPDRQKPGRYKGRE
jgi:ribonuclease J